MHLEVKGLSSLDATYLFQEINFEVMPSSVYGLVELDGETRHKIFKSIIEPDRYHGGEVYYNGDLINATHRAGQIAFIESKPFFFKKKTVAQQLDIHMRYLGLYQKEAISAVLALVSLEDKKDIVVEELSFKDKKKLALARALISKPSLLIIDDLLDGLDSESKQKLMAILWQLKREQQTTILFSTQDLKLLESFSDVIACIRSGRLVSEISVEKLESINRTYLEIKTDQIKEATMLLHDSLRIEDFKLIDGDRIQLFEWPIETNELLKQFIDKDIIIKGFSIEKQTISDYYYRQMEVV